ncbi:MAG: site-specific integrase [Terriglobia bacterium]|jgi:site-specific recombinase XerD
MPESSFQNVVAADCLPDLFIVHLQGFLASLIEQGYADETARWKVKRITDFGQWLKQKGVAVADLDEARVEVFLKRHHQERKGDSRTLQQFLDQLRRHKVIPARSLPCDRSPLARLLSRYEIHLRTERGLVAHTIEQYQSFVRKFLGERFRGRPLLLKALKASDISDFVLRHTPSMNVKRAQVMTTAFRSFFRFLFQKRELEADLATSVPTVANWQLSTVPKYLTPQEVERVLEACDRRTAVGRRDYAILLLLARLGLRAGEVVSLQLEDLNWRAGEILVRGKGLLHDRMPLPAEVGEALACNLRRDRPACRTRRIFVCTRAPRRGFSHPSTLSTIVRRALARAELHPPLQGAHLLRHSLATSMLRSGATMGEIAEILRHRTLQTTEIYAKVDFQGLRSLAHPWPMGGGQ